MKGFIQIPILIAIISIAFASIGTSLYFHEQENTFALPETECPECQECECPVYECPDCECPICKEGVVIEKKVPVEVIKEVEVVKEIPVEKIVYRDKIIYKADPECKKDLLECNERREEMFGLYYQNEKVISSYKTTTTDLISSYKGLLAEFEELIDLTKELNQDYIFDSELTQQLLEYKDFASTSESFIGKF